LFIDIHNENPTSGLIAVGALQQEIVELIVHRLKIGGPVNIDETHEEGENETSAYHRKPAFDQQGFQHATTSLQQIKKYFPGPAGNGPEKMTPPSGRQWGIW
jgi:hypothetical protein